jgi:hypothetical protein
MRLSFDDEESFKEAAESLRFNNPFSDPNARQKTGSSSSMSIQDSESERNEDNAIPCDPNILRRVRSSSSIQETRSRSLSGDIQACFNNPPSFPEFTSANGMCAVPGSPRRGMKTVNDIDFLANYRDYNGTTQGQEYIL